MHRRRHVVTALLVAAACLAATSAPLVGATIPLRRLPPSDRDAIAAIFDPALARLGLRVTRAELEKPPQYTSDPHGDHLAVYVEPIGDSTAATYLTNLSKVAKVFLPTVFDRWKGLRSFDVCQEPLPSIDASPEPPPVTQLAVSRRAAGKINWRETTLAKLVALQEPRRGPRRLPATDFNVYLDRELLTQPAYRQALEERP